MIDLETMGTRAGCAIVALGAIKFDDYSETSRPFYAAISLTSNQAYGLKFDASTIEWWLKQSKEAQAALLEAPNDIKDVLTHFADYLGDFETIWSHGATFDLPILEMAYAQVLKRKAPWGYMQARDTRTLFALAGLHKIDRTAGVKHNALDDATAQAKAVQQCLRMVSVAKVGP